VISDKVFVNFLGNFYDVLDECIQVYPNKHLVIYQEDMEERISVGWKYSAAMRGKRGSGELRLLSIQRLKDPEIVLKLS
jgi:hypothetical protein